MQHLHSSFIRQWSPLLWSSFTGFCLLLPIGLPAQAVNPSSASHANRNHLSSPGIATYSRIAVLDFQAKGGVLPEEASLLSERVRAHLNPHIVLQRNASTKQTQLPAYELLERSEIQALLKEQGFQESLYTHCETDCTQRLGQLLNVDAFVLGAVSRVGHLYVLSARLVDVRRGVIVKEVFRDCVCDFEALLTQETQDLARALLSHPNTAPISASVPASVPPSHQPTTTTMRRSDSPRAQLTTPVGTGWSGYKDETWQHSQWNQPQHLVALPNGNLVVSDRHNQVLRVLNIQTQRVQPYSGGRWNLWAGEINQAFADGPAKQARFHHPGALAVNAQGIVYVADTDNHRIRKIMPDGEVITFVGTGEAGYVDGNPAVAQFRRPQGLALDKDGFLYVADTDNHAIRKVSPHGEVSTLSGGPGQAGFQDGNLNQARFRYPTALTLGTHQGETHLFIADTFNHALRNIVLPRRLANGRLQTGTARVETLAGNGQQGFKEGRGIDSHWNTPRGLCLNGESLYVSDTGNHRIRRISLQDHKVETLFGTGVAGFRDGNAAVAQLNQPEGLYCGPEAQQPQQLWIADRGNHRIRLFSLP